MSEDYSNALKSLSFQLTLLNDEMAACSKLDNKLLLIKQLEAKERILAKKQGIQLQVRELIQKLERINAKEQEQLEWICRNDQIQELLSLIMQ